MFAMRAWPLTFLGFIVLRFIAQWSGDDTNSHDEGGISGLMWLAVSVVLFLSRVGCLGFTLVILPPIVIHTLNASVPPPHTLS